MKKTNKMAIGLIFFGALYSIVVYLTISDTEEISWILKMSFMCTILSFSGASLNTLVMLLNKGLMPAADTIQDDEAANYIQMSSTTRLRLLGDWIPCTGTLLLSPGDILMYCAPALFVATLVTIII